MKPSELKRIVNKEFNIDTLRAYLEVVEDRIFFVEKAMDLGTRPQIKGFMSHMKNLKEALRQLEEEKPGLWANIRAKRARGEKPAHKNSKAHKDAVKAGKKINAANEGVDSDIDTIIKLVKSAKNPKNLPISFGSTSVAIGGTQYDKGELVSMFNGKELGMDSMDIRKVFYNANKDAEAIADKINASNSGVEAKIGHGYGKEPILYLKKK